MGAPQPSHGPAARRPPGVLKSLTPRHPVRDYMLIMIAVAVLSAVLAASLAYTWGVRDGARSSAVKVYRVFGAADRLKREIRWRSLSEQPYAVQDFIEEVERIRES